MCVTWSGGWVGGGAGRGSGMKGEGWRVYDMVWGVCGR